MEVENIPNEMLNAIDSFKIEFNDGFFEFTSVIFNKYVATLSSC